jgi:2',3'-cyclic-nucleotide 2'-phosphodiesterase
MMQLAYFGDVVGHPGREGVLKVVARLRREGKVGFVIANCENAAHGKGVSPRIAEELRDGGIDVLTSGNHVWSDRTIVPYLTESSRLLRPYNLPPGTPGRGLTVVELPGGGAIAVVNLIGRVFMGPADCPFRGAEDALAEIGARTRTILVDIHAEATSEKGAIARYLDGRVSAVIGSHTHVQTADETVLEGGTAMLTDAGMCGPTQSVLGVRVDRVIQRFLHPLPVRFDVAEGPAVVQGALIDVDETSGHAIRISRIQERVP